MKGSKIKEIEGSSKGMYIRIADIPKLGEMPHPKKWRYNNAI